MHHIRSMAGFLTIVFCVLASAPASAIASPPDATTEAATAVSYEEATLKGAVNPLGAATTYWFEYGETTSYGTKIPVSPEPVGSGTEDVAVSNLVTGLKESTTYHFRVVAENEAKEKGLGEDAEFTTTGYNFSFPEEGSESGLVSEPFDLAVDSKGNVWVSDTGNNRIVEFNAEGKYVSKFGKEGTGNGEFKAPKGIAIDPTDHIWVVDSGNNRLQKFDIEGKFILKAGEKGSGEAQFESPTGITIESSGERPWVADTGNNRIEKFSKEGKYLNQFGKKGTGDGELMSPEGVLSDAKARLWVVDTGNDRVQRFSASTLKFVSKFGETGESKGQFKAPIGIACDFQERLWIVDSGNNRLQKFDIEGEHQDMIGKKGSGAAQFMKPTGVEAPTAQKLLATDSGNNRIEKWTVKAERPSAFTGLPLVVKATSAIIHATLNPQALAAEYWFEYGLTTSYGNKVPLKPESFGSGLANVLVEQGFTGLAENTKYHYRVIAESAAGVVFGTDRTFKTLIPQVLTEPATAIKPTQVTLNGKVNPETSTTKYWFEYGETTSYGNQIPVSPESVGSGTEYVAVSKTPSGLKVGTTYHFRIVAEGETGSVVPGEDKSFTTLKPPDATTEPATAIGLTKATLNGKVNPLGSATTYWFEYGETTSYGTKIPVSPESAGSGTEYVAVSQTPTGLKEGTTYHFRVVAENEAGISKGVDLAFKTAPYFSLSFGTAGSGNGQFNLPAGIAIDPEGNVWVADYENSRIEKFSTAGKYLFQFGEEGEEEGQLLYPTDLAIDAEGDVWVTTSGRIQEFSPEGEYLSGFGEWGEEEGQLGEPEGIAIDSEGDIWAADAYNGRLQEFDSEGNLIQVVGSYGSEPGQLGEPTGIDVGPKGNVWVADWQNNRVSEFDEAGEFIRQFGAEGSGNGQFVGPDTIDVDESGAVWVVDEGNSRVQWFDEEGKYLGKFGTAGFFPGEFRFLRPTGIASDATGNLWISDSNSVIAGNRVQKWVR